MYHTTAVNTGKETKPQYIGGPSHDSSNIVHSIVLRLPVAEWPWQGRGLSLNLPWPGYARRHSDRRHCPNPRRQHLIMAVDQTINLRSTN